MQWAEMRQMEREIPANIREETGDMATGQAPEEGEAQPGLVVRAVQADRPMEALQCRVLEAAEMAAGRMEIEARG
jgi:hypothetical protein